MYLRSDIRKQEALEQFDRKILLHSARFSVCFLLCVSQCFSFNCCFAFFFSLTPILAWLFECRVNRFEWQIMHRTWRKEIQEGKGGDIRLSEKERLCDTLLQELQLLLLLLMASNVYSFFFSFIFSAHLCLTLTHCASFSCCHIHSFLSFFILLLLLFDTWYPSLSHTSLFSSRFPFHFSLSIPSSPSVGSLFSLSFNNQKFAVCLSSSPVLFGYCCLSQTHMPCCMCMCERLFISSSFFLMPRKRIKKQAKHIWHAIQFSLFLATEKLSQRVSLCYSCPVCVQHIISRRGWWREKEERRGAKIWSDTNTPAAAVAALFQQFSPSPFFPLLLLLVCQLMEREKRRKTFTHSFLSTHWSSCRSSHGYTHRHTAAGKEESERRKVILWH